MANANGNSKNLVQNNRDKYDKEWVKQNCSKAGKAAQLARYQRKLQRDILRDLFWLKCDDEETAKYLEEIGADPTWANAANMAQIRRAANGDVESMRYIRDTIGEKPTEQMQLGVLNQPVKSLDLTKLSDAELEALADKADGDEE